MCMHVLMCVYYYSFFVPHIQRMGHSCLVNNIPYPCLFISKQNKFSIFRISFGTRQIFQNAHREYVAHRRPTRLCVCLPYQLEFWREYLGAVHLCWCIVCALDFAGIKIKSKRKWCVVVWTRPLMTLFRTDRSWPTESTIFRIMARSNQFCSTFSDCPCVLT